MKMMDMEKFEYSKAMEELELIASRMEDPLTPFGEMEKMVVRSEQLLASCRAYLRGTRERLETLVETDE